MVQHMQRVIFYGSEKTKVSRLTDFTESRRFHEQNRDRLHLRRKASILIFSASRAKPTHD